eukprot:761475-Hanusia_phi.AAC.9
MFDNPTPRATPGPTASPSYSCLPYYTTSLSHTVHARCDSHGSPSVPASEKPVFVGRGFSVERVLPLLSFSSSLRVLHLIRQRRITPPVTQHGGERQDRDGGASAGMVDMEDSW